MEVPLPSLPPPLTLESVAELKLVHLRAALEARGLASDGTKAELADRLRAALRAAPPPPPDSGASDAAQRVGAPSSKRRRAGNGGGSGSDGDAPARVAARPRRESPPPDAAPRAPAVHVSEAPREDDSDGDDGEDDFGPRAPADAHDAGAGGDDGGAPPGAAGARAARPPQTLAHEAAYLAALPSAAMYERSYMHRAQLTAAVVSRGSDFVITGSADGVVKFWKKIPGELEFAKSYRAHLGAVVALAASPDGTRLASLGDDGALKLFDVLNFDMTDMARLGFLPAAAAWIYPRGGSRPLLAVSDRHSPRVCVYNADAPTEPPVAVLASLHTAPVLALAYNEARGTVISADAKGVIEYWSADPEAGFGRPGPAARLSFALKSDTDLFDVARARAFPQSLAVAPHGRTFVVTATDRRIRLFHFGSGRLARVYSEAPEVYAAAAAENRLGLDALDYGRRAAVEKDLCATTIAAIRAFIVPKTGSAPPGEEAAATAAGGAPAPAAGAKGRGGRGAGASAAAAASAASALPPLVPPSSAVFDESGHFLAYPCLLGIKVVNTVTNKVCAVLGRVEDSERFLALALYQGTPTIGSQYALMRDAAAGRATTVMSQLPGAGGGAGGDDGSAGALPAADPVLVACAFRRNRFYLFTRREPAEILATGGAADASGSTGRDVFNEPPSKEDLAVATEASAALNRARMGSEAVVHTTRGDVHIQFMPDVAPKAVENFCTHARNGYFNGHIFHRVIKGFMVQTGDPTGTGTGGASIWGTEFEDEIVRTVRFDRPYCVAMANAGPRTNGSQWFITTEPTPWLDGKHTIFARVTRGSDVVKDIEGVKTNPHNDRPLEDVKIINVDVKV